MAEQESVTLPNNERMVVSLPHDPPLVPNVERAPSSKDTIEGGVPVDARQLTQRLQTLSVTTTTTTSSMSSLNYSCADTASQQQQQLQRGRDVVTPPIPLSASRTPELSPAMLASLRGTGSPSHSQVGATAAFLRANKYDLTPVTRNTAEQYEYVDHHLRQNKGSSSAAVTITPSSTDQQELLHGEHLLALPNDLDDEENGPAMPPLQQVYDPELFTGEKAFSQPRRELIPKPVPFPSPRKYYSFTTREQYEDALLRHDDGDDADDDLDSDDDDCLVSPPGLTPYAPLSRPANFDIESLPPEEELSRIFATRRSVRGEGEAEESSGGDSSSHRNHRLLLNNAIPLGDRIPSLRMANHLQGSATSFSYTDHEDEDSLLHFRDYDDSASLSSRGSSLHLPDEAAAELPFRHTTNPMPWLQQQPAVQDAGVDTHFEQEEDDDAGLMPPPPPRQQAHEGDCTIDDGDDGFIVAEAALLRKRKQRKRKQRRKEQRAVEWLHSVEADRNVLAEAASSKFLTGNIGSLHPHQPSSILLPDLVVPQQQQRRQSVPALALSRQSVSPPKVMMLSSSTASDEAAAAPAPAVDPKAM